MQIGVDFDNIINNLGPLLEKRVQEYFGGHWSLWDIYRFYSLKESLNISIWEEIFFWKKYGLEIATQSPIQRYCKEAMFWLKKYGFTFHIITSRPYIMKPITQSWLQRNHVPYDEISYGVKNKGELCSKLNIPCMIEDADHNIINLVQHNIITVALPYPYNIHLRNKYLIHMKNWKMIANFLIYHFRH